MGADSMDGPIGRMESPLLAAAGWRAGAGDGQVGAETRGGHWSAADGIARLRWLRAWMQVQKGKQTAGKSEEVERGGDAIDCGGWTGRERPVSRGVKSAEEGREAKVMSSCVGCGRGRLQAAGY